MTNADSALAKTDQDERFPPERAFGVAFWVLLLYFVARAAYFAVNIKFGIPPDERTHLALILQIANSESFLGLENINPLTAHLGAAFFLYHWVLGTAFSVIQSFLVLDSSDVVSLMRYANIAIGALSLIVVRDICILVMGRSAGSLLALVVYSNVLMATFLAGSINYDNLTNLLANASLLYLILWVKERTLARMLGLIICLCLGCLTKISFLPFAAIVLGVAIVQQGSVASLLSVVRRMRGELSQPSKYLLKLSALVCCSLVFCMLALWISNRVQYGAFFPSCAERLSHDECLANDPVYRKYFALRQSGVPAVQQNQLLDPIRYLPVWLDLMLEKSTGIFAYSSFYQSPLVRGVIGLLLILSFILALKHARQREQAVLLSVAILYLIFVAYFVNYKFYLGTGLLARYEFVGVQGRYAFPVLAALLIPLVYGLMQVPSVVVRRALCSLALVMALFADLPSFLLKPQSARLAPNAALQSQHIRSILSSENVQNR